MNSKFENNILTIFLEGNIDSNNADAVGAEIESIRNNNSEGKVILDLENLKYISSAGLRQILRLKKKEKELSLVNVSSEVYEIFDMTGFTEMMDIQKAYRKMSVDGCEIIGEGSNGIVYRLNPDTIIKVYKNSDALDDIKRERELAKTALVLGINTAIPFDVVMVDGKYGSVFELLSAKSLTKLLKAEPENKDKYIKVFVDMLKEIHGTTVKEGTLPDAKERAIVWANRIKDDIPSEYYEKLLKLLNEVPHDLHMLHGDYHTNNVHYANNEAILIDMDTLSTGNPVFEFSNIFLAYQGFGELNHNNVTDFLRIDWDLASYVWKKTPELYFEGKDESFIDDIRHKAQVVGFTRLYQRTLKRDKDNTELLSHCKKRLMEELDKVTSLII